LLGVLCQGSQGATNLLKDRPFSHQAGPRAKSRNQRHLGLLQLHERVLLATGLAAGLNLGGMIASGLTLLSS